MSFVERRRQPDLAVPHGARQIAEARQRGKRPADDVLVSFVGRIRDWPDTVQVTAQVGVRYDWRFLDDLFVIVAVAPWASPGGELRRLLEAGPRAWAFRDAIVADVHSHMAALVALAHGKVYTWPSQSKEFDWPMQFDRPEVVA